MTMSGLFDVIKGEYDQSVQVYDIPAGTEHGHYKASSRNRPSPLYTKVPAACSDGPIISPEVLSWLLHSKNAPSFLPTTSVLLLLRSSELKRGGLLFLPFQAALL